MISHRSGRENKLKSNKSLMVLGLLCVSSYACGGEPAPSDTLHVDVEAVVARAIVTPVDGVTSSGQPDQAAFEVFRDSGYVAVIDIRGVEEDRGMKDEAATIKNLGMDYVLLPIEDEDAINFENAAKLDELIASYDGPVLVHCGSGNRVGALLALRKSLDGASDEEAFAYGKEGGLTRLEDVVKEQLSKN
jgi:uncharacterized protein (TIGR01244 family)